MRHSKNSKLFYGYLIDDAIWESTEDILSASVPKYCTQQRIGQNKIGCSFKLGNKFETKRRICFQRIERRRVVQFSKRKRRDDKFHFSVART